MISEQTDATQATLKPPYQRPVIQNLKICKINAYSGMSYAPVAFSGNRLKVLRLEEYFEDTLILIMFSLECRLI